MDFYFNSTFKLPPLYSPPSTKSKFLEDSIDFYISCNVPGYCVISTYIEPKLPEQNWLDRTITLVKLDKRRPRVYYLAKVHNKRRILGGDSGSHYKRWGKGRGQPTGIKMSVRNRSG